MTFLISSERLRFGVLRPALDCDVLLREDERPRLSDCCGTETGDRRPKNDLGDHGDFSPFGERDRADRFLVRTEVAVLRRGREGVGGGCRGVMNLSAGFIVLISPLAIELIEALR